MTVQYASPMSHMAQQSDIASFLLIKSQLTYINTLGGGETVPDMAGILMYQYVLLYYASSSSLPELIDPNNLLIHALWSKCAFSL